IESRDGIHTKKYPCPIDEDILPCTCTYNDALTDYYLDCSEAKTVDELTNAFNAPFPFTQFVSLTIDQTTCDDCSLTSLPAGAIGSEVSFRTITITGTQIETIEEEVFVASHDALVNLHLQSNKIREFPFESLGDYNVLATLHLQGNQFDATTPIPAITSESLKTINLNSNPELIIPPDFVLGAPAIQRVLLRNSKIQQVPLFDESPIGMFTGLQDINDIDFGYNRISEIQTNSIIAEGSTLTTVDFSHNNISILHPVFITGFSPDEDSSMNMQGNAITKLDQQIWEDIFTQLPGEGSIDLSENPILCGCEIAWLVLS
ncbi:Leucine-rich repeat domain L domain-like, partial [Trinorchestia longiramus]